MSKIKILYHGPGCMDGLGAKFAAWKKFGDNADYIPVQYGNPVPDLGNDPDTEVYILDFSYNKETLLALQAKYKRVVVLDHHKTAEAELNSLEGEIYFDMKKSGAVLAWEFFHTKEPVPNILLHVQDRDLWKFEMPNTKEVHAGLGLLKGAMGVWNNYSRNDSLGHMTLNSLKERGHAILEYETQHIENSVPSKVKVIDFLGYKAGVINSGYLVSETCAAIYNNKELNVDLAIAYFIGTDDLVYLSFRSPTIDVSEIAKKHFGGGGHQAASGAKTTLDKLITILNGQFYDETKRNK